LDGSSILIDSKDIGGGEIWQYLFTKEGEFEYHCTYHKDEGMSGKVIIR
jgi:plastocyanin